MAQRPPSENAANNTTAVAIDHSKNSSFAVKWAIDNLSKSGHTLTLIHVRNKHSMNINRSSAHVSESSSGSFISSDPSQIFKPCRLYCARKGIAAQEVLIDETDVSKALLDYINKHFITVFVLGASTRNPIARKFSNPDVPTMINKAAPDFCSVYVISKDKALSIRPAARSAPLFTSPSVQPHAPHTSHESESHDASREKLNNDGLSCERRPNNRGQENKRTTVDLDISFVCTNRPNIPNYNEFQPPKRSPSADVSPRILEAAEALYSEQDGLSSKDLEAKMKRLQLELKQTLDMYNTALLEKHKETLPMAELTKLKGKAVTEAVEKMHKLAQSEAEKTKHSDEEQSTREAMIRIPKNDVRYRKYSLEEIETATNNFAMSSKIGEGGYGPVFKGKLDHTPVAIKVLRSDATQGRQQFQQEIEVLCCMRHPNMVLLLGACPEYGCLVYEYMDNGSLEDRLFRKGNTPPIPWQIRFQIAADIAIGLLFLHQAKPEPLVHRDLKPANILLDRNYICKISDVGLARLVPPSVADNVTQYHMTSAAGTFCYIDPEYQQTGKLGTKSDVYSLGVMLLQIITARPPMGLAHHVERTIEKGTFENILDPTVPNWPFEEAFGFAKLALQCAELRQRDRPDLGSVIVPELNRLKEFGLNNLLSNHPTY